MRTLFILLGLFSLSFIDGLDHINTYIGNEAIDYWDNTRTPKTVEVRSSQLKSDTLYIHYATDWGGEKNAKIEFRNEKEKVLDIKPIAVKSKGGHFFYRLSDLKPIVKKNKVLKLYLVTPGQDPKKDEKKNFLELKFE